jgi:hypothetical protein
MWLFSSRGVNSGTFHATQDCRRSVFLQHSPRAIDAQPSAEVSGVGHHVAATYIACNMILHYWILETSHVRFLPCEAYDANQSTVRPIIRSSSTSSQTIFVTIQAEAAPNCHHSSPFFKRIVAPVRLQHYSVSILSPPPSSPSINPS